MKSKTVNISEIRKSADLNLSPKFYVEFKPKIKEFMQKEIGKLTNIKWVDKLDYKSAELLYKVINERNFFIDIKDNLNKQFQEIQDKIKVM